MTDEVAAKLVAMIAATYPTPQWEPMTYEVYHQNLVDLDEKAASTAVQDWLRTQDRRPAISDLRRAVAKSTHAEVFLPPDEAWKYVHDCFGTVGQYRDFPDTHPLIKKAVDGMGWVDMCRSDNMDVMRGQFRMAYTALLERRVSETAASPAAALLGEIGKKLIGGS